MKLITFSTPGASARVGVLDGASVIDLSVASGGALPARMIDLLNLGDDGMARARAAAATRKPEARLPLSAARLHAPVPRPGKIVCLGRNYAAHAKEGGAEVLENPIIFLKPASAVIGPGDSIIVPAATTKPDYEAELAVIIGRACRDVDEAHALDYVAGYACANDVSARDLQRMTHQWDQGKMPDTFCPLGPALVTRDEIGDPSGLNIRAILNGQEMQNSNTRLMIFSVPFFISYLSRFTTLEPGDILLTGTPDGVGSARNPPVFLQNGDTISVEIDKVGTLTNPVRR